MNAEVHSHGALFYVAAVNLIIWVGLFAYLLYLDRKVKGALAAGVYAAMVFATVLPTLLPIAAVAAAVAFAVRRRKKAQLAALAG